MSKVCVFFGTGFEEIEALTVVDLLRRASVDVSMVSITGEKTVTSSHKITVEMDMMMFGRQIRGLSYVYAAGLTFVFAALVNFAMYYKLKRVEMVESLKSVD